MIVQFRNLMIDIIVLAIGVESRGITVLVSRCHWGEILGIIRCSKALMVYGCWKPWLTWHVEWNRSGMMPHNLS